MNQRDISISPSAMLNDAKKSVLVTVPDAAERSSWEQTVHRELGHHFRPVSFPNDEYKGALGKLNVLIDLRMMGAAFVLGLAVVALGLPYLLAALCAAAILLGALYLAMHRRHQKAQELGHWLTANGGGAPFVIAHGFGSYLVATALHAQEQLRISSLVVASPPVRRDYPWYRRVEGTTPQVMRVRTELGLPDILTKSLRFLKVIAPDLGEAALGGFLPNETVHTGETNGNCAECEADPPPAAVHNIHLQQSRGSQLTDGAYVRHFLLPFLWAIPIYEFRWLLDKGREIAARCRAEEFEDAEALIEEAFRTPLTWRKGKSLDEWARQVTRSYLGQLEDIAPDVSEEEVFAEVKDYLLPSIWFAEEISLGERPYDEEAVRWMYPTAALRSIVLRAALKGAAG